MLYIVIICAFIDDIILHVVGVTSQVYFMTVYRDSGEHFKKHRSIWCGIVHGIKLWTIVDSDIVENRWMNMVYVGRY